MYNNTSILNILDLNDCTLLEMFRFLNATDLWLLSKTCERLNDFVQTKCLWRHIEARDIPNTSEKIQFCLRNLNETTRDVRICADGRHLEIIPGNFFDNLNRANITILALENQKICGKKITLKDFPESLVELSLKKTCITEPFTFITYDDVFQTKNLKVLILDQCFWVTCYVFESIIKKVSSIEILSLYKCKGLYDAEISVIRETFDELRIVDCRFSGLGNNFLKNLSKRPKIREIYFQNYLTTYFPEKHQREKQISSGSQKLKYSYILEHDDIPLWNENVVRSYFGNNVGINKITYGYLSEDSTVRYSQAKCIQGNYNFESVLYKKPYNECTCENNSALGLALPKRKSITRSISYVCKSGHIYTLDGYHTDFSDVSEKSNISEEDIEEHTTRPDFRRTPGICTKWKMIARDNRRRNEKEYFRTYNDVSLTKISFRGCDSITDTTLEYLKHLNLSLLDVTGTKVTTKGVINFALDNLQCRIIHETMCTCLPNLHF